MTLNALLAQTYIQMLKALASWIGKAAEQLPENAAETLLCARLAPDMFPLSTQVRFACRQAQEGMLRLADQPFPAAIDTLLNEGRDAGENPGSIADALARIDETIAVVERMHADSAGNQAEPPIEHRLPNGMIFDLTADRYARDWALPQFYFHVVTAYAILRNNGVALGKADYAAHMFAFLRPGTVPVA